MYHVVNMDDIQYKLRISPRFACDDPVCDSKSLLSKDRDPAGERPDDPGLRLF